MSGESPLFIIFIHTRRSQNTGNSELAKGTKPFPGMRFQTVFIELWSRPRRGREDGVN